MFKIGTFAQMNRVTVKTLRYYERRGLLVPNKTDQATGYRYYTAAQMVPLHRILALKQAGCSITDISKLLENDLETELLKRALTGKIDELKSRKLELESKINHLTTYIDQIERENNMSQDIIIKELPEVIVASYRSIIPNHSALFNVAPNMGKKMQRQGAVCAVPEYCFNIYHDGGYKESDIDVEVCEAVTKKLPDQDGIVYKTMPGVSKAACILHKGSYDTLGTSYAAVMQWIGQNNYRVDGKPRESYIDGIWNKETPEEWLTEIQIPIA